MCRAFIRPRSDAGKAFGSPSARRPMRCRSRNPTRILRCEWQQPCPVAFARGVHLDPRQSSLEPGVWAIRSAFGQIIFNAARCAKRAIASSGIGPVLTPVGSAGRAGSSLDRPPRRWGRKYSARLWAISPDKSDDSKYAWSTRPRKNGRQSDCRAWLLRGSNTRGLAKTARWNVMSWEHSSPMWSENWPFSDTIRNYSCGSPIEVMCAGEPVVIVPVYSRLRLHNN
jgi:hypothetical protein